ncbi:MAG: VWA domain-containing protein [Vicinamibacterales bacterium]
MPRPCVRHAVAVFGILLSLAATLRAAPPQQSAPVFRAGIDVLTIEASVLDSGGLPVGDLKPGDFTVTIDGRPRTVVFSDFHGGQSTGAAQGQAAPTRSAANGADGRIVVFVVDRDSLASGKELAVVETAGTILDSLGPADAVGLLGIPVGSVELTRDHDRVRTALSMMSGTRPRQAMYRDRNLTWEEALGYERRDPRLIAEVVERECYNIPSDPGGLNHRCPDDLITQARELLQAGRVQVQSTTSALSSLVERLAPLRGSKHVILISGGLPFGQDLLPHFDGFARSAAAAQVVLYAIHVDQPDADAADRKIIASAFGGRDLTQGLTALTGMTGGAFFSAVGHATGVFDRIKTEINNFYVLGVESAPDDRPGTTESLKVAVARTGLKVRTRNQIVFRPSALAAANSDRVKAMLEQPTDVEGLTMTVSAYSTRGTDPSTLRVLIASEVGADATRLPVDWGYSVLNDGNVVATGRETFDTGSAGPWIATASAKLLPGRYRLRVAATDAAGRAGVADVPLAVGLRVAGDVQMSDLIVGVADAGKLQPRDRIARGAPVSALIELMSRDPVRLQSARAVIEVIPDGAVDPVRRFVMAARTGASDAILLNAVEIDTVALAPGRYTATVIVFLDNQPVGRVSRAFELAATR